SGPETYKYLFVESLGKNLCLWTKEIDIHKKEINMGAGGRMQVSPPSKKSETDTIKRVPCETPPFTVGELKKAIPPHCFKRSIPRSFSYLIWDIIIASCFYYVATTYFPLLPHPLSYFAWPLYWACQGCVLTGVWVIAHECGHHAFSDYQWLDDTVGLIFHSFLLVPYFSWNSMGRRWLRRCGGRRRSVSMWNRTGKVRRKVCSGTTISYEDMM
ncbi:hypothetical protein HID58_068433, partial [Brassica napus]